MSATQMLPSDSSHPLNKYSSACFPLPPLQKSSQCKACFALCSTCLDFTVELKTDISTRKQRRGLFSCAADVTADVKKQ